MYCLAPAPCLIFIFYSPPTPPTPPPPPPTPPPPPPPPTTRFYSNRDASSYMSMLIIHCLAPRFSMRG